MRKLNQSGSHLVAIAVGVVVIGLIGFAGYKVKQRDNTVGTTANTAVATVPSSINSKADLTATSKALDDSSSQIDSSVNGDSLNSDLNSML